MNNIRFEMNELEKQIADLLAAYPELDDDQLRADMFEGETDLIPVLSRLLDLAQFAASMADAIKSRQDDLAIRKARYERQEEGYRRLILSVMERGNLPKIPLPEATLSIRHIPPAPFVSNVDALPDELVKYTRTANQTAIKAALDNGPLPAGMTMSNGRSSLTIRTK